VRTQEESLSPQEVSELVSGNAAKCCQIGIFVLYYIYEAKPVCEAAGN
jgi:hypothetical protein